MPHSGRPPVEASFTGPYLPIFIFFDGRRTWTDIMIAWAGGQNINCSWLCPTYFWTLVRPTGSAPASFSVPSSPPLPTCTLSMVGWFMLMLITKNSVQAWGQRHQQARQSCPNLRRHISKTPRTIGLLVTHGCEPRYRRRRGREINRKINRVLPLVISSAWKVEIPGSREKTKVPPKQIWHAYHS